MKARPTFPALAVLPILSGGRCSVTAQQGEAPPTWTHSPVDVGPDVLRSVVVHYILDAADVDAPGGRISADQSAGDERTSECTKRRHATDR